MTENTIDKSADRISPRTKWSYCFGGIGRDMAYNLFSAHLLTYVLLTRTMSAAQISAIGIIMIVCRIWDAVNDPVMGGIIENTHTKWGKFKPWIVIGVFTNSIILMLIYTSRLQGWGFIAFFAVMYLLWDITFTMNDIGYWSMLPSLTSNQADRNSTTSWANMLAGLGGGLGYAVIPLLTTGSLAIGGNNIVAYGVVAAIVCCFFIGCQLLTAFGVQERPLPPLLPKEQREKVGLKKLVKVISKNDQLVWISVVMLLYNLGSAIINGFIAIYLYLQFGYEGYFNTAFTVIFGFSGGIAMFIYPWLARKFSRNQMQVISIIMVVTGYVLFFLTGIAWPMNFFVLASFGFFVSFGQSMFYNIQTISISNTVEYNEWKTGSRDEGIIFSMRPLMAKMGSALQMAIVTIVYLALGIRGITNGISELENAVFQGTITPEQKTLQIKALLGSVDPSITLALRACMSFIPIVLLLASFLVVIKKCTISEEKYIKILADLDARRAQTTEGDELAFAEVAAAESADAPSEEQEKESDEL